VGGVDIKKYLIIFSILVISAIFSCGAASATSINITNTTNAIHNAVLNAHSGDTINLAPGNYKEYNITLNKNLTISGPKTSNGPTAVIDAQKNDGIFVINENLKISLNYLLIENGNSQSGGGINSNGNLTIYNCKFQNNNAIHGGAININPNINDLELVNSTFINNTALAGGAIYNNAISTISNCTFLNNTAGAGGAIFDYGVLNVTRSTFQYNTANLGLYRGGAVFISGGQAYINFCRIVENNPNTNQIYSAAFIDPNIITDLNLNWWGSNDNPSNKFEIPPMAVTWLVLTISKTPKIIPYGGSSTIKASFQYDNLNNYHDPKIGNIPDGETVFFTGDGSFSQSIPKLVNGSVTIVFTPNTLGLSQIWTIFDNILYANNITVFPALKVLNITPKNKAVNIIPTTGIKVSFTQPIKAGNMNIELINGFGTHVSFLTNINGNILTIKPKSQLNTGKYTFIMHTGCLTSPDGILLPSYSTTFTTDSTPPIVSTTIPTNLKTSVSRTSTIYIKFSENIKASTYYNNIGIKNLTTGKYVTITKATSGNRIVLKTTTTRSKLTWYQVTIPAKSIKDYTGNNLLATYTFKFKTGT
jgi:autotransporter family porin